MSLAWHLLLVNHCSLPNIFLRFIFDRFCDWTALFYFYLVFHLYFVINGDVFCLLSVWLSGFLSYYSDFCKNFIPSCCLLFFLIINLLFFMDFQAFLKIYTFWIQYLFWYTQWIELYSSKKLFNANSGCFIL